MRLNPSAARWGVAALVLAALGCGLLWRLDDAQRRETFDTQARIAHRLLSQHALQMEAVLATLTLVAAGPEGGDAARRLPALLPAVRSVQQRTDPQAWADARLQAAELRSRESHRAVLVRLDPAAPRALLLRAGQPSSYALEVDLSQPLREADWPVAPGSAVSVALVPADRPPLLLQPGASTSTVLGRYEARKHLAADSLPVDVVLQQPWGWAQLPWLAWALWTLLCTATTLLVRAAWRQRQARRRAEEWLRLGQVARLNTLGELAAGMAHELNQPLTAVLANTQAAGRLLDEHPPELATARQAMTQAAAQARRASEVLSRLRQALARPDEPPPSSSLRLEAAARAALDLLDPEAQALGVRPQLQVAPSAAAVRADPVAVEQILHNLLRNALQALAAVPTNERRLTVQVEADAQAAHLSVIDSGEGLAPEVAARLFQPFVSTREGGLGLGLSLSESLAQAQGGALTLQPLAERGAAFRLSLPRAQAT
ncbi:two-component sensor histidine kinase [Ideonella sp. 4Y11]|uniref:histidine kinase n=1 Tax=Ideonella aquatica TaxID=2824119 RepID=A0A940YLB6_9BURK|nr:two-component sensor histidine kinase [Ideonella aquatica]